MDNEELPDYKVTFLKEMDELRQQQTKEELQMATASKIGQNESQHAQDNTTKLQNNIINTSQYSSQLWKQHLNQTYYRRHHDQSHHQLNLKFNPQVAKKQHNIQLTPISQYSNAMHNKTVFVNPRNISC